MSSEEEGDVILVTGASGFVGQHVVKLLMERCRDVREVRAFDIRPFKWIKELRVTETYVDLVHVRGDITQLSDIRKACRGVDAVVHTAGYVDVGSLPDMEKLKAINIVGAENVLKACIDNHVTRLVYTSTQDVVLGMEPIENADESSVGIPNTFLYEGYAGTKYEAEKIILKANSLILENGRKLKTCSLRPTTMYGEGDIYFLPPTLKASKQQGGVLMRIGDGKALFHASYVGNVAWAHILALQQLKRQRSEDDISGQACFISDDTEPMNLFDFMEPFLQARGFRLSRYHIPYWFMYIVAFIVEFLAWFLQPFSKINFPINRNVLHHMCTSCYFSYHGAKRYLNYSPLFSVEESMERTVRYVKRLRL
ncbi:3 beta-hydroxysteroid dehydrogenase/Delta 5--_4-isomerase-like [Saccoglossus kowalevskii]|uniref:3 beta-hydroxysteroid dehydrogenase/Delta 5-->4-isomerase-like n=1 Tax=Saccoglossus kowalevskii TaxID=10224 RepID=A0ABM0GW64_SACKO|nr:PREDICTED: 3 beta-hydroxysteroid dehydrogenase/Delta 5-->4-isomerase-like [Saccoglossus kowalevskii]